MCVVVVVGGWASAGAWRLVRGALLEKTPSEPPAIDQKLMSGAGIKPAWPLLTFMCWRRGRGETSVIATYSGLCPHRPGKD